MLVHTSPDPNLLENWVPGGSLMWHVFGGVLFFTYAHDINDAADAYQMSAASKYVYAIDEDAVRLINAAELEIDDDLEGWDEQIALVAEAVEQGFDGVIDEDEQGQVYMIDIDKVGIDRLERII